MSRAVPCGRASTRAHDRPPEQGAAAVEFALISTVFLMLLFGIIQYGLWFNDSLNARQGVREAARMGVVDRYDASCTSDTDAEQLLCTTKAQIHALTGDTYVRVEAPARSRGEPLTVCAMVDSDGGIGLLPMPNDGILTAETQMSIEVEDDAALAAEDPPPPGADWSWCG